MIKSKNFKKAFAVIMALALILTACPIMSFATSYTLTFKEVGDEITVVDCKAGTTDLEIVVPETYNGKPVTVIGDGAFCNIPFVKDGEEQLTRKVTLPKTIKKIGFMAFGMSPVDEININELENLEYIGAYAFIDSFISGDIILSDKVTYVGASAFTATAISSIHLGRNVSVPVPEESVDALVYGLLRGSGDAALYARMLKVKIKITEKEKSIALCCPNLKKVTVDLRNPNYRSVNGVLYSKDMTKLYTYPSGKTDALYKMPATVDAFYNAFGGFYIQPIDIMGAKYDMMESSSFNTNALFGQTKKKIEESKFDTSGLYYTTKFASNLKTVVLSERVTEISNVAFYNTGLQRIYITRGVKTIGEKAFWHCTDLETVGFAKNSTFTKLPKECFKDCTSLKNVTFGCINYLEALSFENCTSLESVDLTNVKSVSSTAFDGCTSLSEIVYQDTDSENKATVSEQSFDNQQALQTVILGNSVEAVKSKAFANCENLTTAYISDEIEEIDATAFSGCNNLTIICPSEECYAYEYATANNIPVTTLQVMPIPNQTYTGEAIEPELTVSASGNTLEKGRDYNAYFKDNINVGTAGVTVMGEGDYSIFASVCKFAIIQRELSDGITVGGIAAQLETGEEIKPDVEVTYGDRVLEKDVDYIIEYADNINAGTATAAVIGINNFTGIHTIEFEILENDELEFEVEVGDANGDGKIGMEDYSMLMSYIAGAFELDKASLAALDVNGDNTCDAFDLFYIDLYINTGKPFPTVK